MKALWEVFYQPGKLFGSLADRRGAWIAPTILIALFMTLTSVATIHFIGMQSITRQQLAGSRLTAEQMQTVLARAGSPAQLYTSYGAALVSGPLFLLLIAGCLMAFSLFTSHTPGFATMYSMVALASLPYATITWLMTCLILRAAHDPGSLDIRNLIATNAGAFVDRNSMSKVVYGLLTSLDVLSFLEIGLLSLGFSKVTKSGLGIGLAVTGGLWIFATSIKLTMSFVF